MRHTSDLDMIIKDHEIGLSQIFDLMLYGIADEHGEHKEHSSKI